MAPRWLLPPALALLAAAPAAARHPSPAETLSDAYEVLADLQSLPHKGIPARLVAEAKAVAVIPRVIKAGFVVGGRGGHGVVYTRDAAGSWGEPTFVNLGGASVGLQAGVSSTDLVLVFKNRDALERVLSGKGKLTLGADASIAAGPVGRQVEGGTDARLRAEIVSYSRSRGLFAGVALDGAVLHHDADANRVFREDNRPATARAALDVRAKLHEMGLPPGSVPPPPAAPVPGDRPPPPPPASVPERP